MSLKRHLLTALANTLQDEANFSEDTMANKDLTYGLTDLLDEALDTLEEAYEKYQKVILMQELSALDRVMDVIADIADKYDTDEQEVSQVPDIEPTSSEVIEAEIINK